ncbi:hypothetical protein HPB52_000841 [Rhipicephalus sanguineus]|uniref:Gustatory receptor n=1 Tax=Rhipicephalus sanguineus TaxID=34632 RepID=A0A9D4PD87_RHISA|nr:hypothetical protein HPB52_000841 [Rhipicephalus sanguineus]
MNRVAPSSSGRQAATSQQREAAGCFVIRNFKPYRLLLRFFGCLLIEDLTEDSYRKARVTWRTSYTPYSLLWFSSMVYAESEYIVAAAHDIMVGEFTHSVLAVFKVTIVTTVVANLVSAVLGTGRLLEFFRDCAQYENTAKFRFPDARESLIPRWLVGLMRTIGLAAVLTAYGVLLPVYYGPRGLRTRWTVFSKVVGVVSLAGSMFYEWVMYLTLIPASKVLAWYVRDQRHAFLEIEDAAASSGTAAEEISSSVMESSLTPPPRAVESIRVNLTRIRELKTRINDVWGPALALTAVTTLVAKCAALCQVSDLDGHWLSVLLMSLEATHRVTRFFELAIVSQSMRDEADDIKESAKLATTLGADDEFCKQVLFLHDSIDPDEMCLSGAGFFRLGKPIIVSMMGALITYTVILTQTGQQFTHYAIANVTSAAT